MVIKAKLKIFIQICAFRRRSDSEGKKGMIVKMKDTLVIYYSFSGNSKKVAKYVKEKLNADILELEPATPFSNDYDEVVSEW